MILVDSSTGSRELLPQLLKTGAPATLWDIKNEGADFAFLGNGPEGEVMVGIERKTISDLTDSIYKGRLGGLQVYKMVDTYQVRVVVVEGEWRVNKMGEIVRPWAGGKAAYNRNGMHQPSYSQVYGFLLTLANQAGFQLWRTQSTLETAWTVAESYRWWKKPWSEHKSLQVFPPVPWDFKMWDRPSKFRQQIQLMHESLGWKRTKYIEDHFKKLGPLVRASEDEWDRIAAPKGQKVGKDVVREIRRRIG